MKKHIFLIALGAALFALGFPAQAQQPGKVPRIGFVSGTGDTNNPGPFVDSFQRGLQDLGYIVGKNILVEYRYIEGNRDRIPSIVAELVQLKVDVAVTSEQSWIRAAKQATKIPIVMVINGDPVATGLVESLARPGGNITGLTRLNRELSGKRLELLKEAVPTISCVGVLTLVDATTLGGALKEYQAFVCRDNGFKLRTNDLLRFVPRRRAHRRRRVGCSRPMCNPNAVLPFCTTAIASRPVHHYIAVE